MITDRHIRILRALGVLLSMLSIVSAAQLAPVFASAASEATSTQPTPSTTTVNGDTAINWSGYVETGGRYTSVSASWNVPAIAEGDPNGADATWVGIGGVESRDLIQAGTQTILDESGAARYQAWYELLPDVSTPVPLDIAAGDSVSVSITLISRTDWLIAFRDNTRGTSYSKEVAYRSTFSSAEWIEELPAAYRTALSIKDGE